jgi:glycopeptide antibiotics resistance protein
MCGVIVYSFLYMKTIKSFKKSVMNSLLAEYLYLTLCSTVIYRPTENIFNYRFIPFWSYREVINNNPYLNPWELPLNIVLFVPIGLILGGLPIKISWHKVALIGCGLSVLIELLQLVFKRGICEIDDVMHNTLGSLIGYFIYLQLLKIRQNFKLTV